MTGSNQFRGGPQQTIQSVIPLGVSTVTTQTKVVGVVPQNARVKGIEIFGQAGPTATALTAQVYARTLAGATGDALLSAAADIDFASAAAAKAGVRGVLVTNGATLRLEAGRLIEVTITADTASAGPGDLTVVVEYEPIVR